MTHMTIWISEFAGTARCRFKSTAAVGMAILIVFTLSGCTLIQGLVQNPRYIYEGGAVLVGGDDQPIELINAPNTVNVSYAQLLEFAREDRTDQIEYIDRGQSADLIPFVCSDFAEAVHNNAEAAGIRAGYLGIDWEAGGLGHAVTIFETTDMGTVYIDCTGQSIYSQLDTSGNPVSNTSWDKVAYVEIGQIFGVLALDKAKYPTYEYYREYQQKWDDYKKRLAAYNSEVKQYNQDIEGKVFRQGSAELREMEIREIQLRAKEKELNAIGSEIGTTSFKSLGVVKSISVYW
jgi:hypothetical protein